MCIGCACRVIAVWNCIACPPLLCRRRLLTFSRTYPPPLLCSLFHTLIRFDEVYVVYFKTNKVGNCLHKQKALSRGAVEVEAVQERSAWPATDHALPCPCLSLASLPAAEVHPRVPKPVGVCARRVPVPGRGRVRQHAAYQGPLLLQPPALEPLCHRAGGRGALVGAAPRPRAALWRRQDLSAPRRPRRFGYRRWHEA